MHLLEEYSNCVRSQGCGETALLPSGETAISNKGHWPAWNQKELQWYEWRSWALP